MCLPLSFVRLLVRWAAITTMIIGLVTCIIASYILYLAKNENNLVGNFKIMILRSLKKILWQCYILVVFFYYVEALLALLERKRKNSIALDYTIYSFFAI